MNRQAWIAATAVAGLNLLAGAPAFAQESERTDGGMNFVAPATRVMRDIEDFHNFLLPIIAAISAFVLVLLLWVMIRYNRRANPTPKKFTHNMLVEVVWTVVPVLILVAIAAKSFPLIFEEERIPPTELTLKVTGSTWAWTYEYPDLGVQFTALPLSEEEARAQSRPYLLATDNVLYVPTNTNVHVLITSNDVIHSWAVPAFGVKDDATQGRVNDSWFNVEREGTYYGQCSELCGANHGFMPIEIRAVSREQFAAWAQQQGGSAWPAPPAAASTNTTTPAAQPAPAGQPTR